MDGSTFTVRALRDGRRRAGRAWSTTPEVVARSQFDLAQMDALLADPELIVAVHHSRQPDDPPPAVPAGGGEGRSDRQARIVEAIDEVGEGGRTKSGVPTVAALEAVLGFDISAAERDAAWAAHNRSEP